MSLPIVDRVDPVDAAAYEAAMRRDPCAYCGARPDVLDHITSLRSGGPSRWDNYAPACRACNAGKGPRTLLAFLAFRRHRPHWTAREAAGKQILARVAAERSAWFHLGRPA